MDQQHIDRALLTDLGVPDDYGADPDLRVYAETTDLVDVGPNIVGRMQRLTPATAAAWAGRFQARQATRSSRYTEQLRRDIPDMPLVTLPRLYSASWGPEQVEALSRRLDRELA